MKEMTDGLPQATNKEPVTALISTAFSARRGRYFYYEVIGSPKM